MGATSGDSLTDAEVAGAAGDGDVEAGAVAAPLGTV